MSKRMCTVILSTIICFGWCLPIFAQASEALVCTGKGAQLVLDSYADHGDPGAIRASNYLVKKGVCRFTPESFGWHQDNEVACQNIDQYNECIAIQPVSYSRTGHFAGFILLEPRVPGKKVNNTPARELDRMIIHDMNY